MIMKAIESDNSNEESEHSHNEEVGQTFIGENDLLILAKHG